MGHIGQNISPVFASFAEFIVSARMWCGWVRSYEWMRVWREVVRPVGADKCSVFLVCPLMREGSVKVCGSLECYFVSCD